MTENNANRGSFLLYQGDDGQIRIDVRLEDETVWLTQQMMAELFQTTKQNVSLHIQSIYAEAELAPEATVKKYLTVRQEGQRQVSRALDYYNLDMVISVGYRIKSLIATRFRVWATDKLKEYVVKGFVMDDERLKNPPSKDSAIGDYFDEILERIRDIRASERRFYQKITDIYAQCSVDYDSNSSVTQEFYATVQNKLHWAIHGHTAAELIGERVDADKLNMGLTTWKNAPAGKIRKSDIAVAKNYLNEKELRDLNRIVTMYLDYAEMQVENRQVTTMQQWAEKLDAFLAFNDRSVLKNAGKVSADIAKKLAIQQFEKYQQTQQQIEATEPTSDFDKIVGCINKLKESQKEKGEQ